MWAIFYGCISCQVHLPFSRVSSGAKKRTHCVAYGSVVTLDYVLTKMYEKETFANCIVYNPKKKRCEGKVVKVFVFLGVYC